MKLRLRCSLLAMVTISATGSASAPAVEIGGISRAVGVCAQATSKLGVDDLLFINEGWTTETADGPPGDRFYSKGDLRASLGTRPGVGGSCIISFNTRSSYDLVPLTKALEQTFHVRAILSSPTSALLPLPDRLLLGRVVPTPIGSVVSVALEMRE